MRTIVRRALALVDESRQVATNASALGADEGDAFGSSVGGALAGACVIPSALPAGGVVREPSPPSLPHASGSNPSAAATSDGSASAYARAELGFEVGMAK
jgi:hypothetical protein